MFKASKFKNGRMSVLFRGQVKDTENRTHKQFSLLSGEGRGGWGEVRSGERLHVSAHDLKDMLIII
jgi:hypothetical protein